MNNTNRYDKGIKEMRKHLGPDADKYVEEIKEIAPLFAKVNVEFAFGDIYGNENSVLSDTTKELCTVAALTVQGFSIPQLSLHIECALREGATKDQITEVITQMIPYCGFPAATNAILEAKKVFNKK